MQGAGDRAGSGDTADSPTPFCTVAPDFIGHFDQDDIDFGMCFAPTMPRSRNNNESGRSVGGREVFRERIAQSHVHAALHLLGAQARVDRATDVVRRHDALGAGHLPRMTNWVE